MNIIEFGVGPHAERTYLPAMRHYGEKYGVKLSLVVDLKNQESLVRQRIQKEGLSPEFYFVDAFDDLVVMPDDVRAYLGDFVRRNNVEGVIISTEPFSHVVYAQWALELGLNILMDKPISTRPNVTNDIEQARGLEKDFVELLEAYTILQSRKKTVFSVNCQRRYYPGFTHVFDKIREISRRFDCPVTSIQSNYSDGQWRLPGEIVTQEYHPYSSGYGKISHGGYHIIDVLWQIYKEGMIDSKRPNEFELYSSFVQPEGLLYQLNEDDYLKIFGEDYHKVKEYSDAELFELYRGYGEVDVSTNVRMLKNDVNVCNISFQLLHNTYARRHWMYPGTDLYRGNGRVKHESHFIHQGPFQTIQIHSYRTNEKSQNDADSYKLGGDNHFEINVFRNKEITGDTDVLTQLTMEDIILNDQDFDRTDKYGEWLRRLIVIEFFRFLAGEIEREDMLSNITEQGMSVRLMRAMYESHILASMKSNPVVRDTLIV